MAGAGGPATVLAEILDINAAGTKRLTVNGHLFRRTSEGAEYWSCLERHCPMTAVTRDGLVTLLGGVPARGHAHPPATPQQQLAQALTASLLRRVRTNLRTPVPALFQQELDSLMASITSALPSYETVRSRLYRARQAAAGDQPESPPAADTADRAAACAVSAPDGTNINYSEADGQGSARTSIDADLNTGDVTEGVSPRPDDAVHSEGERSDTNGDLVGCTRSTDTPAGETQTSRGSARTVRQRARGTEPRRKGTGSSLKRSGMTAGAGAVQTTDLPPAIFGTSARGLPTMQVLEFQFRRWKVTQSSPPVEYWTCTADGCRSTATTRGRRLTRLRQRHAHEPPTEARRRAACLVELRRRARLETTPMPQLYRQERERAGRPDHFPSLASVRTILYRERQQARRAAKAAEEAAKAAGSAAVTGAAGVATRAVPMPGSLAMAPAPAAALQSGLHPSVSSHGPQPSVPSHLPQPSVSSHGPQPIVPAHGPQPIVPAHVPQPIVPAHLPQPIVPSHGPQPCVNWSWAGYGRPSGHW
ncbi:uncharacterized protein LOC122392998 isoform X2 [Amphibalanus amphitrite]|uniref:uncharacterized protein LOC122392998 isoform X2 n=1 Tax=Amphibalanus amphitrite TaxID=1232801 RepID=UPI001C91F283|nr:uncharacterized protein LOC122392998 isoform X2 [Amphibalanus amphitrite]